MMFSVDAKAEINEPKVAKALTNALAKIMFTIEAEAVRKCPVDTGRLRASIHLDKVSDYEWVLADGVEYGIHQEYGTIYIAAQPFFRPALNLGMKMAGQYVNAELKYEFGG